MGATAAIATTGFSVVKAFSEYDNAQKQADALVKQAQYQSEIGKINAELANLQAGEAIKRGDEEANKVRGEAQKIISAQKVGFAAGGIDVSQGSALALQEETYKLGAMDAVKIKNNAWREAQGYKLEALNTNTAANLNVAAARTKSNATLATGGLQALGSLIEGASASGYLNTSSIKGIK